MTKSTIDVTDVTATTPGLVATGSQELALIDRHEARHGREQRITRALMMRGHADAVIAQELQAEYEIVGRAAWLACACGAAEPQAA